MRARRPLAATAVRGSITGVPSARHGAGMIGFKELKIDNPVTVSWRGGGVGPDETVSETKRADRQPEVPLVSGWVVPDGGKPANGPPPVPLGAAWGLPDRTPAAGKPANDQPAPTGPREEFFGAPRQP